jgi:hypothetical protein
MAIPKYPKILTASDWNLNKGLLVRQYKTGVAADMKVAEADYKRVSWDKFDANKALKNSGGSAQAVQNAYADAFMQFRTKVQPLINVVDRLTKRAAAAKTLYTTKKAAASSIKHAAKVEAAAKLFSGQLKLVHAELEQFKRIADNPTVESVVGTAWFTALSRSVRFPTVQKLTAHFASAPKLDPREDVGHTPDRRDLPRFRADYERFKAAITRLLALRPRRQEIKVAKTQASRLWNEAVEAYSDMLDYQGMHKWVTENISQPNTIRGLTDQLKTIISS